MTVTHDVIGADSTFSLVFYNSNDTTYETLTPSDLYEAQQMLRGSEGKINDGEYAILTVHNHHSTDDTRSRPCGILARYDNINNRIVKTVDNLPKIPKLESVVHCLTWSEPAHVSDPYSTYQTDLVQVTPSSGKTSETVANNLLSRPEGRRGIILERDWNPSGDWDKLFSNASDQISFGGDSYDSPVPTTQGPLTAADIKVFFEDVKARGATIDYICNDLEGNANFAVPSWNSADNAVDAFETEYLSDVQAEFTHDGNTITDFQAFKSNNGRTTEGHRVSAWLNRKAYEAVWQYMIKPILEVFPSAIVMDYNYYIMPEWSTPNMVANSNGYHEINKHVLGHCQSPVCYGEMDNIATDDTGRLPSYIDSPFVKHPFNVLKLDLNRIRMCVRNSDLPVVPWFNTYEDTSDVDKQWQYSIPYWNEMFYQMCLSGVNTIQLFNPNISATASLAMEHLLETINIKFNGERAEPIITSESPWNDDREFIYSGVKLYQQNKSLWRITVNDSITDFTVNGTAYTINPTYDRGVWFEGSIDLTDITIVNTT